MGWILVPCWACSLGCRLFASQAAIKGLEDKLLLEPGSYQESNERSGADGEIGQQRLKRLRSCQAGGEECFALQYGVNGRK